MTRHGEELDDTIDRIASAMTFAPADPALARRVAERINDTPPSGIRWPRLAMGVAVVIGAIVGALNVQRESTPEQLASRPAAREISPRLAVPEPSRVPATLQLAATSGPVRAPWVDPPSPFPQISALDTPPALGVVELASDPLAITPVDLAPLELAALGVAEIDGGDEEKE